MVIRAYDYLFLASLGGSELQILAKVEVPYDVLGGGVPRIMRVGNSIGTKYPETCVGVRWALGSSASNVIRLATWDLYHVQESYPLSRTKKMYINARLLIRH
jgi:hypothetical protein